MISGVARPLATNLWCYVQACLVGTLNLAQNLMANLHIARVSSRFLFTNLI